MKTIIYIILTLSIINSQFSIVNAQNLVPNPSFEEYSECPNNNSQFDRVLNWNSYQHFSFELSPDYFNSCAINNTGVSIPDNFTGIQNTSTGNAYCGIYTYISNFTIEPYFYHEIVYAQLTAPLVIGSKYYVSIKVSLAEDLHCASNNLGVLFTTYYDTTKTIVNNFAHIYSTNIITDTLNWVEISGSFIADSSYNYIYIGNFFHDTLTNTTQTSNCFAYYYIDDICVSEDSLTCVDITNQVIDFYADTTHINIGNSVNYTVNTIVDYDYYHWEFENAVPATSTQKNPTNIVYNDTGSFNVELVAYNYSGGGDTITKNNYITVTKPEGILEFSNSFELINNPYDNQIIIKPKTSININNINVYDILGKQIKTSISKTNGLIKITLNQNTKNGIYILKITNNKNQSFSKKIVKF